MFVTVCEAPVLLLSDDAGALWATANADANITPKYNETNHRTERNFMFGKPLLGEHLGHLNCMFWAL